MARRVNSILLLATAVVFGTVLAGCGGSSSGGGQGARFHSRWPKR